jgi:hypothetical protein
MKHTGVRECLNKSLWMDTVFLTGSYSRSTMIRPPSDIDLFVVLDYSKHGQQYYPNGIWEVLERFHRLLKDCYPYTPIRKDPPAINLNFSSYGFDVVPAFRRQGGGYLIPNVAGSGWIPTDPQQHGNRTSAMNTTTGGYFVPLVKIFKSWNVTHFSKLTGFHLEMLMANAWPRTTTVGGPLSAATLSPVRFTSYASAVDALFPALVNQLNYYTSDPAGMSGNIDEYLSMNVRTQTRTRLTASAAAADIAIRHEGRGDHYSAITKWRDIFGDPLPAYS